MAELKTGEMYSLTDNAEFPKDRQFVTALARGLRILSCFSEDNPQLNGSELAKLTGLPQPTVWRLCYTMLKLGMLITTAGDKMRPGLPVLRLGNSALTGISLLELARPHMQTLAETYSGACSISTPDGISMVFLERCESKSQLVMNLRRGSVVPMSNSSSGWAYMAGLSIQERESLVADIAAGDKERWATSLPHFKKAMSDYVKHGFVLNKGVFHPAYNTVATPVFSGSGKVLYALNMGASSASVPAETLSKQVGPKLVALARLLRSVSTA